MYVVEPEKQKRLKFQTHLNEEFASRVNRARGIASASAYIRAVLEQHFEENPNGELRER